MQSSTSILLSQAFLGAMAFWPTHFFLGCKRAPAKQFGLQLSVPRLAHSVGIGTLIFRYARPRAAAKARGSRQVGFLEPLKFRFFSRFVHHVGAAGKQGFQAAAVPAPTGYRVGSAPDKNTGGLTYVGMPARKPLSRHDLCR